MGVCLPPIARLCLELRTCRCTVVITKHYFPVIENVEMLAKENKFHLQPYFIEIIHFYVFASSLF